MAWILCIEDEVAIREDVVEALQDAGHQTLEAEDGREGLEVLLTSRPDLVLCDITMPEMNGYDLITEIHEKHPDLADVPFIFLSALADRRDVIVGKQLGADDYITKPIDYELLLVTVESRLKHIERMARKALL